MRGLNETLLFPEIQALFFKVCNYPAKTRIPKFRASENILAGVLSDIVHLNAFEAVVYASDMNIEHKIFYEILSKHFGVVGIEYDSIQSSSSRKWFRKRLRDLRVKNNVPYKTHIKSLTAAKIVIVIYV